MSKEYIVFVEDNKENEYLHVYIWASERLSGAARTLSCIPAIDKLWMIQEEYDELTN